MGEQAQYLKSAQSGRVFMATAELLKRSDMIPCSPQGKLLVGHTADIEAAVGVRESKYIGFPDPVTGKPGRLLIYSKQLSLKDGAVSIDNPEDWPGDVSNVVGGEKVVNIKPTADAASGAAPALSRSDSEKEPEKDDGKADKGIKVDPSAALSMPDVSSIGDKKEAQSVLCKWAFENFEVQLNRTLGVSRMVEECQRLVDESPAQATDKEKSQ